MRPLLVQYHMDALQHGDERGQSDSERRQQDMPADNPGELQAGEEDRI